MSLLPVDDALKAITQSLAPLKAETITMKDAASRGHAGTVIGRVLAEDVHAAISHPPHDVSAMDGYAVRFDDIAQQPLTIIGESAAGHPFGDPITEGQAVRIFTGGHCPQGSDTIIIQEDTSVVGNMLTIHETSAKGAYIRPEGNDFAEGDLIARSGDVLTVRMLALMASAGIMEFALAPRPKVAIISTGDELVAPGMPAKHGQIISSNGLFLKNYMQHIGAEVMELGIVADDDDALNNALNEAVGADLIITSGGASVGTHDGVAKAMGTDHRGDTALNFWRIAMRPGKPLIFGQVQNTPLLGLPGNPVSTGVCAMVFAATAIRALTGQDISQNGGMPIRRGVLGSDLKANDKRQDFLRASLDYDDTGRAILTPFAKQDSGMMHHFTSADALVIRPAFADAATKGELVDYLPIPDGI